MTHLLTASRLYIAQVCPGFASLKHLDIRTPEAAEGSEDHAKQDAEIKRGNVPALYRERWPGLIWRSEIKFAVNPTTGEGRELGSGGDRNYARATADEIPGTADVVGISPTLVVVIDKKSYDPNVPRAAVNAQVHIAALAFCRAHRIDTAHVAIDHKVRAFDVHELDVFSLEQFRQDLAQIVGAVKLSAEITATGGQPILNEGPHCRWCPAFDVGCPIQQAHRDEAAKQLTVIEQGGSPVPYLDDDDTAARAYQFSEQLGMLKKRWDAALYARAKERPIPVRPGVLFGPVLKEGNDKLDADKLYEIVREKHGQGIADAAVVRTATKKRLDEALEFTGVASKAAAKREVLDELRKRGGIANDTKHGIEEYPAPPMQLKAVP